MFFEKLTREKFWQIFCIIFLLGKCIQLTKMQLVLKKVEKKICFPIKSFFLEKKTELRQRKLVRFARHPNCFSTLKRSQKSFFKKTRKFSKSEKRSHRRCFDITFTFCCLKRKNNFRKILRRGSVGFRYPMLAITALNNIKVTYDSNYGFGFRGVTVFKNYFCQAEGNRIKK